MVFPGIEWSSIEPQAASLKADNLTEAVEFALATETPWPRDLSKGLNVSIGDEDKPPYNTVLGPTRDRAGPNGLVIRHGQVAARWGDTTRVDMTFSATKSYLALLAGIAVDDGLIGSIDDPVALTALDDGNDGYTSAHNAPITWRHLLQQTSEWQGTLWDRPDWVDHHRQVGPGSDNSRKGTVRTLQQPGTFWEYNDVRVNRLSLSLLHVFKQPLAEVLRERIMQPVGASDTWRWHAYDNARVVIDGKSMPSVPGGAHWGGGLFISSEDHARVGWLVRNQGRWGDQQLISSAWLNTMLAPCEHNPLYGCLWWLNTDKKLYPSVSASSVAMYGAGYNLVWIDAALDLLVVVRWIDNAQVDALLGKIVSALQT